ncbi:hypothetical protein KIN20_021149 [Parelaphostrongylus tenuis]|uniref:Uncharacterized protein n=1 Tax=Parelaphostrongylus tenuis TaxID=148309 RepID=A0AAD5MNS5_PARTN|nr:hypothetical protein KIN20_021149 [Parelaphostrongylus tenuis]
MDGTQFIQTLHIIVIIDARWWRAEPTFRFASEPWAPGSDGPQTLVNNIQLSL